MKKLLSVISLSLLAVGFSVSSCGNKSSNNNQSENIDSIVNAKVNERLQEQKAKEPSETEQRDALKKRVYDAGYKVGWGYPHQKSREQIQAFWSGYCRDKSVDFMQDEELFTQYCEGFNDAVRKSKEMQ